MPKKLSASALAAYRHDGYYFQVQVLSPKEVSYFRGCLAAALAMKQRAAQFLFQELDGARKRGLRNVALFRGAREIEFPGHGEELTNLVHFHGEPQGHSIAASGFILAARWNSANRRGPGEHPLPVPPRWRGRDGVGALCSPLWYVGIASGLSEVISK